MKRLAMAICTAGLAGCGGMGVDCAGDWYSTGQRDARINAGSQAVHYSKKCSAVDVAKYEEGYADTFSKRGPPGW